MEETVQTIKELVEQQAPQEAGDGGRRLTLKRVKDKDRVGKHRGIGRTGGDGRRLAAFPSGDGVRVTEAACAAISDADMRADCVADLRADLMAGAKTGDPPAESIGDGRRLGGNIFRGVDSNNLRQESVVPNSRNLEAAKEARQDAKVENRGGRRLATTIIGEAVEVIKELVGQA